MSIKYTVVRLNSLLRNNLQIGSITQLQYRNSSYKTSKTIDNINEYTTQYEKTNSPDDWKYVERLLSPLIVPKPKPKMEYSSGWKPQSEKLSKEKYNIQRTKNYMIPVYLLTTHRGMRKITKVRRIQGDIFALESELKSYLESTVHKEVATQVNEMVGYIQIKGDYVNLTKDYLSQKGF